MIVRMFWMPCCPGEAEEMVVEWRCCMLRCGSVRSEFLVISYSCKVVPVETIRVRVEDVKVPADVV